MMALHDPEEWILSFKDMLRFELRGFFVVLCGVVLILGLGLAVPIAGRHLADQRAAAEQGEAAAPFEDPEEWAGEADSGHIDDGWSEEAVRAAELPD